MAWRRKWKRFQEDARKSKVDNWKKISIAPQTWLNLRILINGFFGYANSILKEDDVNFVPAVHCTSSILEASFSFCRSRGLDHSINYGSAVGLSSLRMYMQYSAIGTKSKMNYKDDTDERDCHNNCALPPSIHVKSREQVWISKASCWAEKMRALPVSTVPIESDEYLSDTTSCDKTIQFQNFLKEEDKKTIFANG